MSNIGWLELLIILAVIAAAIYVPKLMPRLARFLRKKMHRRRKGTEEDGSEAETHEKNDQAWREQ